MMRITAALLMMAACALVLLLAALTLGMPLLADWLGKAIAVLLALAFPVAIIELIGLLSGLSRWLFGAQR